MFLAILVPPLISPSKTNGGNWLWFKVVKQSFLGFCFPQISRSPRTLNSISSQSTQIHTYNLAFSIGITLFFHNPRNTEEFSPHSENFHHIQSWHWSGSRRRIWGTTMARRSKDGTHTTPPYGKFFDFFTYYSFSEKMGMACLCNPLQLSTIFLGILLELWLAFVHVL